MVITDYLKNYIGQEDSKSRLNFYINSYYATGILPPILVSSARGTGKTELVREVAKNLYDKDGKIKRYIEVNSSGIKSIQDFVNDIYNPYINGNQYVTLLLDECHNIPFKLMDWLLSVFNTEVGPVTSVSYGGQQFDFDFRYLSVLTATTNPEKLNQPFISRFRRFDLAPYKLDELASILISKLNKNSDSAVNLDKPLALKIAEYGRDTPREMVHLSKDIVGFCEQKGNRDFNLDDWEYFKKLVGLKPLNLNRQEIEVLKCLQTGDKTLTHIASKLKLDVQCVRKDVEPFLLNRDLMIIDQKRKLTRKGREILSLL
jgi:Holliday junction resolvasome RuvABC ATP-dependent DNA helicase subunit